MSYKMLLSYSQQIAFKVSKNLQKWERDTEDLTVQ